MTLVACPRLCFLSLLLISRLTPHVEKKILRSLQSRYTVDCIQQCHIYTLVRHDGAISESAMLNFRTASSNERPICTGGAFSGMPMAPHIVCKQPLDANKGKHRRQFLEEGDGSREKSSRKAKFKQMDRISSAISKVRSSAQQKIQKHFLGRVTSTFTVSYGIFYLGITLL